MRSSPLTRGLAAAVLPATVLGATLAAACSSESSSGDDTSDTIGIELPEPRPDEPGEYAVGRQTVTLVDGARGDRELTVDIWYPADAEAAADAEPSIYSFVPGIEYASDVAVADPAPSAEGPFPLVLYSHGSGGLRYVSSFLTETLASHGFVVVAPDHAGNTAIDSFAGTDTDRDQTALNRPADTAFVISAMLGEDGVDAPEGFAGLSDPERIGMVGHSFGGFTSLVAPTGYESVPADERIDAVVAWAPYSSIIPDPELEALDVPTLLMVGSKDETTPPDPETDRPWDLVPGRPLFRVDISDAGHQSFTDICEYQVLLAELPDVAPAIIDAVDEYAAEGCTDELIDIDEAHRVANLYTVSFLLVEVAGDDGPAVVLTPQFAETIPAVTFQEER